MPPELESTFDFASDFDPLDQTPTFDPTEPEPIPEFDFDQRPSGWD